MPDHNQTQIATFGTGCFWCSEAGFAQLPGVAAVLPGYMGGTLANPTYQDVCTGETGHAEVVQVTYDPAVINYDELLAFFFKIHDPTQLNRQGADVGTQYRSIIFYHSDEQKNEAEQAIYDESKHWEQPVATALQKAGTFYPAEDNHRNYYFENKSRNPYCQLVIKPKLGKLGLDH